MSYGPNNHHDLHKLHTLTVILIHRDKHLYEMMNVDMSPCQIFNKFLMGNADFVQI